MESPKIPILIKEKQDTLIQYCKEPQCLNHTIIEYFYYKPITQGWFCYMHSKHNNSDNNIAIGKVEVSRRNSNSTVNKDPYASKYMNKTNFQTTDHSISTSITHLQSDLNYAPSNFGNEHALVELSKYLIFNLGTETKKKIRRLLGAYHSIKHDDGVFYFYATVPSAKRGQYFKLGTYMNTDISNLPTLYNCIIISKTAIGNVSGVNLFHTFPARKFGSLIQELVRTEVGTYMNCIVEPKNCIGCHSGHDQWFRSNPAKLENLYQHEAIAKDQDYFGANYIIHIYNKWEKFIDDHLHLFR